MIKDFIIFILSWLLVILVAIGAFMISPLLGVIIIVLYIISFLRD